MNKKMKQLFLLIICAVYTAESYSMFARLEKVYQWGKSVIITHADSLLGAHYQRAFNYNRLAADECKKNVLSKNGVSIELFDNKIIAFNDGKKTPLLLGNIPHQQSHIDTLKAMAINATDKATVEIMTMNIKLERDKLGLSNVIAQNSYANLFKYPTIDLTPPHLIDLIRIVRDIENRDARGAGLVFVHCRAGAGRSPVGVAAYLINTLHGAGFEITPDQIIDYISLHRPQVKLTLEQRGAVYNFYGALIAAGSFANLFGLHKHAIALRDTEIIDL